MTRSLKSAALVLWLAGAWAPALSAQARAGAECPLVITETPLPAWTNSNPGDLLDRRYPAGSRIVLARPPFAPQGSQPLSTGLLAAGNPLVSPDARRVLFVGKAAAEKPWQIYEVLISGGHPRPLTSMPGGAMDPALLPDGRLVFASPVPGAGRADVRQNLPALYTMAPGAGPRQLTFSSVAITEPVVLSDGRILFVSPRTTNTSEPRYGLALYTINNDGTEITAFAAQHDRPARIERPRQLADGRLVFLAAEPGARQPGGAPEFVRMARPFQSRDWLIDDLGQGVRSVEPVGNGDLLVCAPLSSRPEPAARRPLAVFHVGAGSKDLGEPLFWAADWDRVEAVPAVSRPPAMGRLSMADLTKRTGQVLCLNANDTTYRGQDGGLGAAVARVRVLAEAAPGKERTLGEVAVQADGSFMAEVPANTPLGFEALDERGRVLRREAPMIWVRPGENRACLGCHEPHNHSPHNRRPEAVRLPVPCLSLGGTNLAQMIR